jgi:hypothetical protein
MLQLETKKEREKPFPLLSTLTVDQKVKLEKTANELLATADNMVIQYARPSGPRIKMTVIKGKAIIEYEDLGNETAVCETYYNKDELEDRVDLQLFPGTPVGVALAFVHKGVVYIGWSKRNCALQVTKEGATSFVEECFPKPSGVRFESADFDTDGAIEKLVLKYAPKTEVEPLPFSKSDARYVAVIRGLCGKVVRKDGYLYFQDGSVVNAELAPIPDVIQKPLNTVILRAEKYFKDKKIANFVEL